MRTSHTAGSNETEFHFIHVFSLKMGNSKSISFTAIVYQNLLLYSKEFIF